MQSVPDFAEVSVGTGGRSLPVYLMLDTSNSMEGAPIQSLREGLELFQRELSNDPVARQSVKVGVITFGSTAELVGGTLVPFTQFQPPMLRASGATRLDLGFEVLIDSIDRHVTRPIKGGQKGDLRPNVYVLTDGRPTDERGNMSDRLWKPVRASLENRSKGQIKPTIIVAVGCGTDVDDATLKEISTGPAFRMGSDRMAFVALFQYVTQSVSSSVGLGGNEADPFANQQVSSDLIPIP